MDQSSMPENVQRYIEQIQQIQNTTSNRPDIMFFNEWVGEESEDVTAALEEWEVKELETLIKTGCNFDLDLHVDTATRLQVSGKRFEGERKMFLLDSEQITAHNIRSKHLIPLLRRLARDEGLAFNLVDEYPHSEKTIKVAFWQFKNRREVDDSDIVLRAEPRLPEQESQAFYGSYTLGVDVPF